MSRTQKLKRFWSKLDLGHLRSQKFAGFLFAALLCFFAGIFQYSEPTTANVIMGIVGCYTAFVGGRAYQDGANLKYGPRNGGSTSVDIQVKQSNLKNRRDEEETDDEKEVD